MSSARSRASRLADLLMRAQRLDDLVGRRVITGLSEYFGSCRIMAMRLPRIARRSRGDAASRSMPSKVSLVADDPGLRRRQAA